MNQIRILNGALSSSSSVPSFFESNINFLARYLAGQEHDGMFPFMDDVGDKGYEDLSGLESAEVGDLVI